MTEKKKFLLRLHEDLYTTLEKWAADDLRSVNAQIEFLLTDAIKKAERVSSASKKGMSGKTQKASG